MDNNRNLYKYTFEHMYQHVKREKDDILSKIKDYQKMKRPLLQIVDDNAQIYSKIEKFSRESLKYETAELLIRLFRNNNIDYETVKDDIDLRKRMPLIMNENGLRIAYYLAFTTSDEVKNCYELMNKYNLDEIRVVVLAEFQEDENETLSYCPYKEKFITYKPIRFLFDIVGVGEYDVYKEYCKEFNASVRELIGYGCVSIPSAEMITKFKRDVEEFLCNFEYSKYIPEEADLPIIRTNYINNERYRVLLGNSDFAESFVSAEWYYSIKDITGGIEQTGIVAGYFKAIEQLLYSLICLSIDTGREIKSSKSNKIDFTTDNLNSREIDTTLGSLIGYVVKYSELWEIGHNQIWRNYIKRKLNENKNQRNDLFHKKNIFDEIEDIRNQTIVLAYLLLGGYKLSDEQIDGFAPYRETSDEKGIHYEDFEEWLTEILDLDDLSDKEIPICFMFDANAATEWHLRFCTCHGFKDNGYPDKIDYPYCLNNLNIPASLQEEVVEMELLDFIKYYLEYGKHAKRLKTHSMIALGRYGRPHIVYELYS